MQPETKLLGTPSGRNTECKMQNKKQRLKEILDAEFMWSEKDCEAVADYLIASGLGFVDDLRKECGSLLAAKDIIINGLHEEVKRLKKENEVLWKKHTPIPAAVKVIDEEFDIKIEHCPVCGARMFFENQLYCRECGQALIVGAHTRPLDDTEIGMIANINDRT